LVELVETSDGRTVEPVPREIPAFAGMTVAGISALL